MEYTDAKMNVDFLYLVCIRKDGSKEQMILPTETNINEFIPKLMQNTNFAIINYHYTKEWEYLYNFRWFIWKSYNIESLI